MLTGTLAHLTWLHGRLAPMKTYKRHSVSTSIQITGPALKMTQLLWLRLICAHKQALVRGDAEHNKRVALAPEGGVPLTDEEQAACLLHMATDANILGRAYRGWRPWL